MKTFKAILLISTVFLVQCSSPESPEPKPASPVAPQVSYITTDTSDPIYPNDLIVFKATVAKGDAPLTYTWDFGDGTTSAIKEPGHKYTSPGEYAVSATVSNSQGSDSKTITITIEKAEGSICFWSKTSTYGSITVTIGSTSHQISSFYSLVSDCSENVGNAVFKNLPWGTYTYTATALNGVKTWTGEVVFNSLCKTVVLE